MSSFLLIFLWVNAIIFIRGNSMERKVKERSSIITIILVIFIFIVLTFLTVKILNFYSNTQKNSDEELYYSHLDEEDKMKEEYEYLNDELNGIYAFGISDSNVVAIKGTDEYINITSIDDSKEYDYLYYNRKLYLLEKDTGTISVIPLDKEYEIESQINLNCTVDSFEVYDEDVYYISGGILFKYTNNQVEEICNNVTSKKFIIKNDMIYLSKNNTLVQIDMQKNETNIQDNVKEIYYYDYYERNKLVYDVQIDDENNFKGVYNFYTKEITNSIKNDVYFIPYNSSNYIYLTNEKDKVMLINKAGSSNILYSSESYIDNISFLKDKYLQINEEDSLKIINIENKEIRSSDNPEMIKNIRYIK